MTPFRHEVESELCGLSGCAIKRHHIFHNFLLEYSNEARHEGACGVSLFVMPRCYSVCLGLHQCLVLVATSYSVHSSSLSFACISSSDHLQQVARRFTTNVRHMYRPYHPDTALLKNGQDVLHPTCPDPRSWKHNK